MIERATDRTIVTDFGIAVVGDQRASGEVIGTARYMSPEQASGDALDGRSDLYALGATIFFALTGRPPFEAASVPALLAKQVTEPAPPLQAVRPETSARLAAVVDRCLRKEPAERFPNGEELASTLDQARGRDMRSPPLVRRFMRNAQVSTMVFLAASVGGQGFSVIIGTILIVQLVIVARRLLREGYSSDDIRTALLAEAQAQEEEADAVRQGRFLRRLDSLWHRLWAGRFGRWFFRMAGLGVRRPERPALPSADRTELVLGRSVEDAYAGLTLAQRDTAPGLPGVVQRLEGRAARLRERGETGPALVDTVAALENLRLALLRLSDGTGTVQDLTAQLERARAIGDQIDAVLGARDELRRLDGR